MLLTNAARVFRHCNCLLTSELVQDWRNLCLLVFYHSKATTISEASSHSQAGFSTRTQSSWTRPKKCGYFMFWMTHCISCYVMSTLDLSSFLYWHLRHLDSCDCTCCASKPHRSCWSAVSGALRRTNPRGLTGAGALFPRSFFGVLLFCSCSVLIWCFLSLLCVFARCFSVFPPVFISFPN